MSSHPSLIVVSNRLPIKIKKLESGSYECSQSTGGLTGALSGLTKSMPFRWFGWPGLGIPREDEELVTKKVAEYNVQPIFLDSDLADKYYNGFSSQFPLFPWFK
jgi:trehalose 6-phosphate synthase